MFRRYFRFILVGSQYLVPRSSSATVNTVASSDCSIAAPFSLKSCQAARWLAQKWMPFLAAPYQQDDHVSPQMSSVSSPGAWHGPRSYCGIAGATAVHVFVDKV